LIGKGLRKGFFFEMRARCSQPGKGKRTVHNPVGKRTQYLSRKSVQQVDLFAMTIALIFFVGMLLYLSMDVAMQD